MSKCHIVGNHMSWLNYNRALTNVNLVHLINQMRNHILDFEFGDLRCILQLMPPKY